MSINFQSDDPITMDCWPLAGFAPGRYAGKCINCKRNYLGEKRSSHCLECAVKTVKAKVETDAALLKSMSNSQTEERIVAAAVFHGSTISLPPPARHHTILHSMHEVMGVDVEEVSPVNQGFLTSHGRFVNRTEAYYIAYRMNQIIRTSGTPGVPTLFSEDLW